MFTIYGYNTFNPIKVLLTAEELGIDYQYVKIELGKGENKTPEYLQKHPLGKVPALEYDGIVIQESAAICRYLARLNDHRLYSDVPLAAARIDTMMDICTLHLGRWLSVFFWQEIICRQFFKKEPDTAALAEAKEFLDQQIPYLEQQLSQQTFLCGDEVTLADIIAYSYLQVHETTSIDLSEYSAVQRWYALFSERPSVIAVRKKLTEQPGLLQYP